MQYMISTQFYGAITMPIGLRAPTYMAFALPSHSALKKPLDPALVRVTASPAWRSLEESYFER